MIKIEKLNPFGRMCISLGMLPSSYKESLTYEEQLLWFFKYLDETVIPTVNNNADAVEELQALYLEIKTYVDEYFENLDVQEEINNKLDDMAESGQLTDIIAQYLQLAGVLAFDNITDLKNAENITNGSIVYCLGRLSYNDKNGSFYKIRNITNVDVIDDVNILAISNDNSLIAEKIYNSNIINVKSFGALGDGITDDSTAINAAITYLKSTGGTVYFPDGTYIINSQIVIPSCITLDGIKGKSIIKASSEWDITNTNLSYDSMIKLEYTPMEYSSNTTSNISIKNISLDNNQQIHAGKDGIIQLRGLRHGNIENVDIIVNGENCWGLILFSSNKFININNISINNTSNDNSSGGCLWIRSGINVTSEDMKTYSINVTNSYFSSTAKDELICISDGISGGWTETKINNCTLNGKAVTNYSSFLMVINSLYNTSYVKAEINNINFKGNCNNYGLVVGKDTINASCVDFVNSNLIFTLDNGGGVRTYGTDGREKFYINNSSINVNTSANAAYNISLNSCYCNSKVVGCNIYNCLIENLTGRACEDCRTIMNSIIKAGTQAIHSYGAFSCSVLNNKIYADSYGIHLQNNSTVGCNNCIVCNNFIQRLNNNDNSGSIGIYAPYCTNSSFSNNRTLVKTGATTGSSYGFNTWYSLTNASNTLIPENATVSYV